MNDVSSLTHTRWNCKYHIVFAPKYRRKVFYGEKAARNRAILRTYVIGRTSVLLKQRYAQIMYMLVEIPPKVAISALWDI